MQFKKTPTMMKILFALLIISINVCAQNDNNAIKILTYYNIVSTESEKGKDEKQSLINNTVKVLLNLKTNQYTTKQERDELYLQHKKLATRDNEQISTLMNLEEIDPKIDYKNKALQYVLQLDTFLNRDYDVFLTMLNDSTLNSFDQITKFLFGPLTNLNNKQIDYLEAKKDFQSEYNISPNGLTTKGGIEYIDLADLNFDYIKIDRDEKIRLLSFSGGKNCNENTVIYKQFIGIRVLNGDTVRILTACQTYDIDQPKTFGYFSLPHEYTASKLKNATKKLVAFNKQQFELERKNLKTCIGELGFAAE